MSYSPRVLRLSEPGRDVVARAVATDHDWALPVSSADLLIAALSNLSDTDLEAAYMFAASMREAVATIQIRRDMQRGEAGEQDA